jgi:hypothetical protein
VSRFPKPILDTVTLANGDTITVRRTLTHGETTDMFRRLEVRDPITGETHRDTVRAMDERILAYLVDWSFTDDTGDRVPFRELPIGERADVIRNLDSDSAVEISKAIHANVETHTVKKTPDSVAPLSLATSR